jgi:predicted transcriptional regulator
MNVFDVCQRHVVTVRRHEELATAAWMMRERNVGCLVVVDSAGAFGGWRPVGLLTDRDIVTNVFARECDPRGMVVEEVMARHPLTVAGSATVDEVWQRMRSAVVRRVAVLDERDCLAGILSLDDILEHLAQRVPVAVTPIRPEMRPERRFEPPIRPAAHQPGSRGIDRI